MADPAAGEDGYVDNISTHRSLSKAVSARKSEYSRPSQIRIKIGSWNVAALDNTENDLGEWFVHGKGIEKSFANLTVTAPVAKEDKAGADHRDHRDNPEEENRSQNAAAATDIPGDEEIGIYVLGLQEIVDINSATENFLRSQQPDVDKKWQKALSSALPAGYRMIASQQLIGLLLLVFASPLVAPSISSVSVTTVGTGLMGYMGNKGAVAVRIFLGETTRLVFINSHLAAGTEKGTLERRNWDTDQVLSRAKFSAVNDGGGVVEEFEETIGDEDYAFWFGDLNYRLEGLPGDDVRRLLELHAPKEFVKKKKRLLDDDDQTVKRSSSPMVHRDGEERSNSSDTPESFMPGEGDDGDGEILFPSASSTPTPQDALDPQTDPTSMQTTITSLLPHDQLRKQQASRKAFADWSEGPITFLPTYKYDVGTVGVFDSSEKKRSPSWCDRILYRTQKDKVDYERKLKEEEEARKKDEEMKTRGMDKAAAEDNDVLFDYDPETDGLDYGDYEYDEDAEAVEYPENVVPKQSTDKHLRLVVYNSHQRILSSDHKPLSAVFTLNYDAVIPELKSKIQQEVARELDRLENEARPIITVVVDVQEKNQDTDGKTENNTSERAQEGLEFGNVRYRQPKLRYVTIANTGRVKSTFGFASRPSPDGGEDEICRPWLNLRLDPLNRDDSKSPEPNLREIILDPGEAMNVLVEILVDDVALVRALNDGNEKLEDVLVLRVENGRDHFIPAHGIWQQTCFGRSIEELIRIPEGGARSLGEKRITSKEDVKWSAPRELFRLTGAIEEMVERVVADWGMTHGGVSPWEASVGWPFNEHSWTFIDRDHRSLCKFSVREALDTDKDLLSCFPEDTSLLEKTEALAETLIDFLGSMKDRIITPAMWEKLERGMASREKARKVLIDNEEEKSWILDILTTAPNHNISFVFLTSMLSRVASEVAPLHHNQGPSGLPLSPVKLPTTPPKSQRRARALSGDPVVARRQQVERSYATVFASVVIAPSVGSGKRAIEEKKGEVLEVLLRGKWDEEA